MFEVSWCVSLYVTILVLEFLPVPFERCGMPRAMERWQQAGPPLWVVVAVSAFVWLLSRNLVWPALTAAVFGALAWRLPRARGEVEPVMLAIAAVTLSTMHQSSLGSLYLLVPDKLDPAVVVAR